MPPSDDRKLTRRDLSPLFVVAQCLDDQWVPPSLLKEMIRKGKSYADVAKVRNRGVRAEYRRALVNARQVVANRAYLYNTPVVIRDYEDDGDDREAFKTLLNEGTLLPFLYSESDPAERPPEGNAYDRAGFHAWERVCREADPACVRLSWNDELNQTAIDNQLTRRFSNFASNAYDMDPGVLCDDLGLSDDHARGLSERLKDLAAFKLNHGRTIRRTQLYEEFINAPGTRPDEGKFDPAKPYAAELKQLIDLNYNVNLPDALDGFALTPSGGLPRTALQELQRANWRPITADELVELVQRFSFSTIQEGLVLESMADLTLSDVVDVRKTDEWEEYAASVERIIEDPFSFADHDTGAMAVYRNYARLAEQITNTVVSRRTNAIIKPFKPIIEFIVEAAGKSVVARWLPNGSMEIDVAGQVAKGMANAVVPLVGRLVVRAWTERGGRTDIAMSADIFSKVIDSADEQLEEIAHRLRPKATLVDHDVAFPNVANINVSVPAA